VTDPAPSSRPRKEAPNHWFALLIVLGIPVAMIIAYLVWWLSAISDPAAP
jgi:hypothetical protein